jgi:hypothetical protein
MGEASCRIGQFSSSVGQASFRAGQATFSVGHSSRSLGGGTFLVEHVARLVGRASFPGGDVSRHVGRASFAVGDVSRHDCRPSFPVGTLSRPVSRASFPIRQTSVLIGDATFLSDRGPESRFQDSTGATRSKGAVVAPIYLGAQGAISFGEAEVETPISAAISSWGHAATSDIVLAVPPGAAASLLGAGVSTSAVAPRGSAAASRGVITSRSRMCRASAR